MSYAKEEGPPFPPPPTPAYPTPTDPDTTVPDRPRPVSVANIWLAIRRIVTLTRIQGPSNPPTVMESEIKNDYEKEWRYPTRIRNRA